MSKIIQMKDGTENAFPRAIIHLGYASTTAVSFNKPVASAPLLVISAHNSTAGLNGIWLVGGTGTCFKLAGGANVTITGTSTAISVKTTAGSANIYALPLVTG